ncbi:hypothetical protein PENSPDRAFT_673310 [Peniophora sp. CONT]|nr:hypothetical protein PENSPDRAFT_673310 [Peniophora sp. CONT]
MRPALTTRAVSSSLSTVARGTAFEERSLRLLRDHLSMSLARVGGKSDGGIDLAGWWWLPHAHAHASDTQGRRRLRVLAQCKAESKKMGPAYLRELEGVALRQHAASDPHADRTLVAALISQSAFTKACLLAAQASPVPLMLLHLPEDGDGLGTAIWNAALGSSTGVLGGEAELRWAYGVGTGDTGEAAPALFWRGARLQSWTPP